MKNKKIYFENLSSFNKETFEQSLSIISTTGVPVYRFDDKYAQQNIWYDYRHVVIDEVGIIFSEDILNLIIDHIDS